MSATGNTNSKSNKAQQLFHSLIKYDTPYLVSTTMNNKKALEEYIRESINRKKSRGVGGSAKIAVNTIKQAFDLCKKSGFDVDYNETEYADNVKVTIRIKK